jgi:dye decolorizing peroxidase
MTGHDMNDDTSSAPPPRSPVARTGSWWRRLTRRDLLLGAGSLAVGAVGSRALVPRAPAPGDPVPREIDTTVANSAVAPAHGAAVPAAGVHQAGITRPDTPQPHTLIAVLDLGTPGNAPDLLATGTLLATVGRRILELTSPAEFDDAVTPDGPGDLTVTVGVGPRLLAAVDPDLPAAEVMPAFAGDDGIAAGRIGGDVLLQLCATDPTVLDPVLTALEAAAEEAAPGLARRRWTEHGYRAPGTDTVTRNPLGYLEGIQVPRGTQQQSENLWISPQDSPCAAAGTVCVLRRLVLDVDRFTAEPETVRDRTIGRHRLDGSPLSGGNTLSEVDLHAKTPQGEYLLPSRSHARAAHPTFTGSHLMLRRGYTFTTAAVAGGDDGQRGLFFIGYQRTLATFVRTQQRLDETDDLMDYVTPTATGSWLILPGHGTDRPLGSTLFPTD